MTSFSFVLKLKSYEIRFHLHAGLLDITCPCRLFPRYTQQSSNVFISNNVLPRTAVKRNVLFSFVKNVVHVVGSHKKARLTFFLSICIIIDTVSNFAPQWIQISFILFFSLYVTRQTDENYLHYFERMLNDGLYLSIYIELRLILIFIRFCNIK